MGLVRAQAKGLTQPPLEAHVTDPQKWELLHTESTDQISGQTPAATRSKPGGNLSVQEHLRINKRWCVYVRM